MNSDPKPPGAAGLFGSIGGGVDVGTILQQAVAMQQQLANAQNDVKTQQVTGTAAGGKVTVTVTGGFDFVGISIDPSLIDPNNPAALQALITAAAKQALQNAQALLASAMQKVGGGLHVPGLF